jgi:hypothetical protein
LTEFVSKNGKSVNLLVLYTGSGAGSNGNWHKKDNTLARKRGDVLARFHAVVD